MKPRFWQGSAVRIETTFRDVAGAAVSASGVQIVGIRPTRTTVSGTVMSGNGTGEYFADLVLDTAGTWSIEVSCSGPTPEVEVIEIIVNARPSAMLN